MQLWFTPVVGGGQYLKIYDQGVAAIDYDQKVQAPSAWPTFQPEFLTSTQRDQVFTVPDPTGATKVGTFSQPLSNTVSSVNVVLDSIYRTADDAMSSVALFAALLEMKVHFRVVQGLTVHYYPNATVTRYSADLKNIACTHKFTFSSDIVTTAVPPIKPA